MGERSTSVACVKGTHELFELVPPIWPGESYVAEVGRPRVATIPTSTEKHQALMPRSIACKKDRA